MDINSAYIYLSGNYDVAADFSLNGLFVKRCVIRHVVYGSLSRPPETNVV